MKRPEFCAAGFTEVVKNVDSVLVDHLAQLKKRLVWLQIQLYKEFIEVATQCYADALQHEKPDIPGLINLYGTIGRMRVLSSPRVLASAEQIGQKIINMTCRVRP